MHPASGTVILEGGPISISQVAAVAREDARVELGAPARRVLESRRAVLQDKASSGRAVYGISTGFGALARLPIALDSRSALQHAVIRSHAAGMGAPVEREVVRAMMLLRAKTLAMGLSGVRPVVVDALVSFLNAGITPLVPEHGSLGASGDLAPLAHVALALTGEGPVLGDGAEAIDSSSALAHAGLEPLRLEAKEGLSLINGTDGMLGMLALACADAGLLFKTADVTAAMSIEALLGTDKPFAPALHSIRPHPGQARSAANLTRLLAGSEVVASHRHSDHAVQDSYSLRCSPQVAGAARDTLEFARSVADRELASAIDNPVVLPTGEVESTGNFHGAPLGFAADFLAIAAAEVGAIAERRLDRILDPMRSQGLPPFLAEDAGVNSGLMLAQYTAAALVAENRRLAAPASVDSLPTSGMQEDHVSMGWGAVRKLRRVLANLGAILGIEALCAARGLALRAPLGPAEGTGAAARLVNLRTGGPGPDRHMSPELEMAAGLACSGAIVAAAESAVGDLG
ncbi:MAG: histidine ammonia-lyase [Actinobacteria bacterium]|nr:histidine ammonia-lyase [Actinomycetota bacterium]